MKPPVKSGLKRLPDRRKRSGPAGFTLIELMVVVAFIAILASLLLPSLAQAKEKTKSIQCLNNFHQLHIAWSLYTEDENGTLPINQYAGDFGKFPDVPC